MIAKLPKQATILEDNDNNSNTNSSAEVSSEEVIHEMLIPCKKSNKVVSKKSPKKTKKSNSKVCNAYIHYISLTYPFIFENNGKYLYIIYYLLRNIKRRYHQNQAPQAYKNNLTE